MFNPNGTEKAKFNAFLEKHFKKCKIGKVKMTISYGSAIGVSLMVKCPKCKKTKDITDYSVW